MATIEIDELRRLRAAGTQGEWTLCEGLLKNEAGLYVGPNRVMVAAKGRDYSIASTGPVNSPDSHADAALICAAVNSLPSLLDELARTRAQRDEARERLGMADQFDCGDGWQVCRLPRGWVVVDPDGDWISSESGHHVALPQDDRRGYFPTADAAFAALAAARKEP